MADYRAQLASMGNDVTGNRGKMLHLILTLCHKVERAFGRIVDGGEGGGERILEVFDVKLKDAIYKLPFGASLVCGCGCVCGVCVCVFGGCWVLMMVLCARKSHPPPHPPHCPTPPQPHNH